VNLLTLLLAITYIMGLAQHNYTHSVPTTRIGTLGARRLVLASTFCRVLCRFRYSRVHLLVMVKAIRTTSPQMGQNW
jgi:hypothetical protein